VESVYSNEPSARTEESTIHKTCAPILFYIIRDSLTFLSRVNWFSQAGKAIRTKLHCRYVTLQINISVCCVLNAFAH